MANEITIQDAQREAKLSLPQCAILRVKWLGEVEGRKYLSAGLDPLTPAEVKMICSHIEGIENELIPARGDTERKMTMVAEMMLSLAGGATDRTEVRAKHGAYTVALAGIPAWAVRIVRDQWYAGKVKDIPEGDFKWPPWPAVMSRACDDVLRPYHEAIRTLRDVLDAKPLEQTLNEIDTRGSA